MDLKEWAEAHLEQRKDKSPNIVAKCPACHVNNGQFALNYLTGSFQCKRETCGLKGNKPAWLISIVEGITFKEAAEKYDLVDTSTDLEKIAMRMTAKEKSYDINSIELPKVMFKFGVNKVIEGRFLEYLTERKIDSKTINDFGLGYCISGEYKERIIIPINTLDFRAYTGRTIDKNEKKYKYKNEKGNWKHLALVGLNESLAAFDSSQFILCEGPFDTLSLYSKGYSNAAVQGTVLDDTHVAILRKTLPSNCKIILMFDPEVKRTIIDSIALKLFYYFSVYVANLPLGVDPGSATKEQILTALILAKKWNGTI